MNPTDWIARWGDYWFIQMGSVEKILVMGTFFDKNCLS